MLELSLAIASFPGPSHMFFDLTIHSNAPRPAPWIELAEFQVLRDVSERRYSTHVLQITAFLSTVQL